MLITTGIEVANDLPHTLTYVCVWVCFVWGEGYFVLVRSSDARARTVARKEVERNGRKERERRAGEERGREREIEGAGGRGGRGGGVGSKRACSERERSFRA